jgi:hypothetical protein
VYTIQFVYSGTHYIVHMKNHKKTNKQNVSRIR